MANLSSKQENQFAMVFPPLVIQGELSLAEAKQRWSKTKQPVVLLDLSALRQEHQESLAALPRETANIQPPDSPKLFEQDISRQPKNDEPTQTITSAVAAEITQADLPKLNSESNSSNDFLAPPPLTKFELPKLELPKLELPKLEFPVIPLPKINFLNQKLKRVADIGSHFFLGAAVSLLLLFATPMIILESQPLISQAIEQLQPFFVKPEAQDPTISSPSPQPTPEPAITSQEDVFSISVPDLEITSTIVPNVDPNDEKAYTSALKKGIAHALGSALPGQFDFSKTIYLFAHSTDAPWNILRYNAQFYALKDAEPGQEIAITFWGEKYSYTIEDKQIIEPNDVSFMQPQFDREQLILQTCYPPGTSQKRLVIIATPSAQLK